MLNKTIEYYNNHAQEYINKVDTLDLTDIYSRFLLKVPDQGKILDAGCGSGRDTLYFSNKGYQVEAIDGSIEFINKLRERVDGLDNIEVRRMYFNEVDIINEYEGIWCCASLLHVRKRNLLAVMSRLQDALKQNCPWYMSFKHGDGESRAQDGRYFTYMNDKYMNKLIAKLGGVGIYESWISKDARPDKDIKWYNCILIKKDNCGMYWRKI